MHNYDTPDGFESMLGRVKRLEDERRMIAFKLEQSAQKTKELERRNQRIEVIGVGLVFIAIVAMATLIGGM